MQPLLTPEQMAQADKATIDAGTSAEVLMDRAGRAVARAAIELMGGRYGKRALVVCGKGSNGGDGFVVARALRGEGVGVDCLVLFDPEAAKGAPAHHLKLMREAGVEPIRFERDWDPPHGYDVAIDAIFGTGFKGAIEDDSEIAESCGCPALVASTPRRDAQEVRRNPRRTGRLGVYAGSRPAGRPRRDEDGLWVRRTR